MVDKIHLVNDDDEVLDAEQIRDETVAAGLRLHAVTGVNQDNRQAGGRGARGHLAGVIFVNWGIRDDKLTIVGGENE